MCVQAVCASAQSEALEMREAGLSFSPEHTNSVTTALACWTSLFERCLEHFLFILKVGCCLESCSDSFSPELRRNSLMGGSSPSP